MIDKSSNSVGHIAGISPWLRENAALFGMRLRGLRSGATTFSELFAELDNYASTYARLTGKDLRRAKVLEIGYGARPNRLLAMTSMGYDATGIDLDRPILKGSVAEFSEVYKANGPKRAFKSFVRNVLFDGHERRQLERALVQRGSRLKVDLSRFLVGDAGNFAFPARSIDFVYSEDVFEHIPPESLQRLCENLSAALSDDGIAMISPVVFSGIAGGHLVEWYPHTLDDATLVRQSQPWEHLRERKLTPDCYLNEWRVEDFKRLFSQYFDIVEVINCDSGMGRQHLSPAIRAELAEYSEEELLSHKWTFVLRRLRTGPLS